MRVRRPLIHSDELLSLLARGGRPLIVDVRWSLAGADRAGYAAGHLPGAVFCDLDRELASEPGDGGRHPLPTADAMTATMRRLGVARDRDVVVYDGGAGAAAARAWWCLRWAGHERVRVLDGGLAAWVVAGGEVEQGDVEAVPAPEVVAAPGSMPVVSAEDVLAGRAGTLLDARTGERFRGETEPIDPVAGHLPGAVSCPTSAIQGPEGRYLSPDALRSVLGGLLGEQGSGAAYCGSGVTASQLVLAAEVVGIELALYPGSWSHWIRDPARPVATGA